MEKSQITIGNIHSIDTFSSVDGPGIRFVVFMQGCQMHCGYCQNRDTWDLGKRANRLGVTDLMVEITQFQHFYTKNQGGITVSGGEPTLQHDFVRELFIECRNCGIHTCLDTNGFIKHHDDSIDRLLDVTDLVLLDIKSMDENQHIKLTGVSNRPVLEFARHLNEIGKPVWVRHVIVPGLTDSQENIEALGAFSEKLRNIQRIELIPYHELGKHKWKLSGLDYPLEGQSMPTSDELDQIANRLLRYHPNIVR